MMPNTSVSPAASRNSSRPNCRPFRHCSMNSVMTRSLSRLRAPPQANGGSAPAPPPSRPRAGSLHRAFVVELILAVLDDGGDGLEHVVVALFHHVLQIEVLDRDVVVAELESAAHRLEVGFLQRLLHRR